MYALSPFTMHGGWTIWELRIRMTPIAYLVGATPTIPLFYSIRREEEKKRMSTLTSAETLEELKRSKELCIENFTSERVANLRKQIKRAYEPGIGIGATVLSRILFGYQQAIYKYEGIAYHFFNLVATRSDGSSSKRKGALFFVYAEDAGKTEFPVCKSDWHNVSEIASKREELENSWSGSGYEVYSDSSSEEESSSVSKESESISDLLSELSSVFSRLAKVFSSSN